MSVNIQYELKDHSSIPRTSIRAKFYYQKKRFIYSLGPDKKIFPELWNSKTQRPIQIKSSVALKKKYGKLSNNIILELKNISNRIDNVNKTIDSYFGYKETRNEIVDFNELKELLHKKYSPEKEKQLESKETALNDYIDQFITNIESGEETYTSNGQVKKYGSGTIKGYKGFKNQFEAFQKSKRKVFDWDDITLDFYDDFVSFFVKKKYTTNSIGKQVKFLKRIMSSALSKKHHTNIDFKLPDFKTLKDEVFAIALNEKELEQLFNLDLSNKPNYELTRDVFLVGCYTALRYSDYSRIEPVHIKESEEGKRLEIITKKTNKRVIIPIRSELDFILKKYEYRLPKTYEQKVNRYIKEIAKLAKINDVIEYDSTIGAETRVIQDHKYNLIKTHTARRTGATLMYKNNVPILDIMTITGHTKQSNLLKYIKIEADDVANRIKDNQFFRGKTILKKVK